MQKDIKKLTSEEMSRVFSDADYSEYLALKGIGFMWLFDAHLENEDNPISMYSNLEKPSAKMVILADSLMGVVRAVNCSNYNAAVLREALDAVIKECKCKETKNEKERN